MRTPVNPLKTRRVQWLLWISALGFWVALALFPVSYRITRLAVLFLTFGIWFGLVALIWQRRPFRFLLLGITILMTVFLALPSRRVPPAEVLRGDYIAGLQRYNGVIYYWGGESFRGIDCSGLI